MYLILYNAYVKKLNRLSGFINNEELAIKAMLHFESSNLSPNRLFEGRQKTVNIFGCII